MKKLPGLLLLIIIALQPGCQKSNESLTPVAAHVRYGGESAADGMGYYINLDVSKETIIPVNLPSSYKHTDVDVAVTLKFVDAGKRFYYGESFAPGSGLRGVYIVDINPLSR